LQPIARMFDKIVKLSYTVCNGLILILRLRNKLLALLRAAKTKGLVAFLLPFSIKFSSFS
jgi:hypothetical protein